MSIYKFCHMEYSKVMLKHAVRSSSSSLKGRYFKGSMPFSKYCVMQFFKDIRNRTMNKINWQYSIAFIEYCLMEYSMLMPKKCSMELFKERILWILKNVYLIKYYISIQQKFSMELFKGKWSYLKGQCSKSSRPFCQYSKTSIALAI